MKNKKWIALLMSAAMVVPFGFAACNNDGDGEGDDGTKPTGNTLTAPQVTLDGNVLSWAAVENADSYSVYLVENNQNKLVSEQTGLTYNIPKTDVGEYNYYVVAQNSTLNIKSSRSITVTYTIAPDTSTLLSGNIYLVGDSTVCSFSDNYYLPRYGYGTQLYNYINCEPTQIKNLALSGRSSKSYLTEGNYTTLKNSIKAGDYLIIGFGHNDEKDDDAERYTSPTGDKETEGSFQKVLYDNYIKLAKDKGATPILCTPVVRYDSTGAYTGSIVHVTSNGDYVQAIKNLGEDTDTTVIDLTTITKDLYKQDNEKAQYYHAFTTYKGEKPNETPNGRDNTHLNMYGAKTVAFYLTQRLLSSDCTLKNSIKTNSVAPNFDIDYPAAIKENYVRPPYTVFDESNTNATKLAEITTGETVSKWYATVMGNVGSKNNVSSFTNKYEAGTFTVGTADGYGKFEDKTDGTGTDGFAAAFTQVSAAKNFTVSAHVKVKSVSSAATKQSGFGIMLRDDMYIDTYDASLNSNYIVAGVVNGNAIFNRQSTEDGTRLTIENNSVPTVAANSEYDLTITRLGQRITVTVKVTGGATYTKNFNDFDLISVDMNNMYVCLVANRGDIVEFTNVQFEITGDAIGA